jgi:hypothetical protein
MKKNRNILLITLLTPLLALATETDTMPGDFGDGDDSNPLDTPIDANLWILLIVGCIYVGYTFYYKKRLQN